MFADFQEPKEFSVSRFLGSTTPSANFSIGNGLGVALVIQSTAAQDILTGESTTLCVQTVRLEF